MTPQPEPTPPAEGALAASPPAASAAAPPADPPRKPKADLPEGDGPQWAAWQALLGFFAAYLGTATAVLIVSLAALPAGVNLDDPPPVFNIVGVLVQDVVFIVAAIAFAAISACSRRLAPAASDFACAAAAPAGRLACGSIGTLMFGPST